MTTESTTANPTNKTSETPRQRDRRMARTQALDGFKAILEENPFARVVIANNPESEAIASIVRDLDMALSRAKRLSVINFDALSGILRDTSDITLALANHTLSLCQKYDLKPTSPLLRRLSREESVTEAEAEDQKPAAPAKTSKTTATQAG